VLNNIVIICGKNNFEFILTKDGEKNTSQLLVEEKTYTINLPDEETIDEFLSEELKKLKEMFQ
jgi:predicted metal-dependent hydrolase